MRKSFKLRQLAASMNDSYSTAELFGAFSREVSKEPKQMDVFLLRETLLAMDDRTDDEAAPNAAFVWSRIMDRIHAMKRPFALKMPRRRLAVLVITILLLMAAAALAAANWSVIVENVFRLEHEQGQVSQWSMEQKQSIVALLSATDYDMHTLPDMSALTDEQKNTALTQWLEKQFDGKVNAAHYNVMQRLEGFFDGWSPADKAWYSQMLVEEGEAADGDFISMLPPHGDEGSTIALQLANQELLAAYDNTDLDPESLTPYLFYGYVYPDTGKRYWRVHYRDAALSNLFTVLVEDTEPERYTAQVTYRAPTPLEFERQLEISSARAQEKGLLQARLEKERGLLITWSFEQQAELFPGAYGVPSTEAISAEQAYAIARTVYREQTGVSEQEAATVYCYSYYIINGERPYYSISLFSDVEAVNYLSFCIEVYADGQIRNIMMETGGNG